MGKIASLIALVKRNLETLDELVRRHGAAEVVEDYGLLNASLHLMQAAIQTLIDAAHLLVELGAEPPSRYSDVPSALAQHGLLNSNLVQKGNFLETSWSTATGLRAGSEDSRGGPI
ncbi:DUF86 domain-containing protein [Pyrobaculum ferrireducens]|nr:HepT-like ribonuclease domain-containing protein [Pyrobaculum ferrireducens]